MPNSNIFKDVFKGMSMACLVIQCVFIAGETAVMPGFYNDVEFDLSVFELIHVTVFSCDFIQFLTSSGLFSR